jgi:hypothetical protein
VPKVANEHSYENLVTGRMTTVGVRPVIRVSDQDGNVIATHEHAGDFKE